MPFTTTEARNIPGADLATRPAPSSDDDDLIIGLRLLLDMARHVALPRTAREEHQALVALRRLQRRDGLPQPAADMRDELARFAELADEQRVRHLLDWFEGRPGLFGRPRGASRRRRERFVLLFILLAKTINLRDDLGLLRELNLLGYWGNQERLVRSLSSLRRRIASTASTRLAVDYLESAGAILFQDGGLIRSQATISVEEFALWPWPSQVLHLLAWRARDSSTERDGDGSLSCRASRLEFILARAGLFGRTAARGGRLARVILARLGYSDYRANEKRRIVLSYLLAGILAAGVLAVAVHVRRSMQTWDRSNHILAAAVLEKRDGQGHPQEPPSAVGVRSNPASAPTMASTKSSKAREN